MWNTNGMLAYRVYGLVLNLRHPPPHTHFVNSTTEYFVIFNAIRSIIFTFNLTPQCQ